MGWYEQAHTEACDHPNNYFTDDTTGEKTCRKDGVSGYEWSGSPHAINEGGKCTWFEAGKHKDNHGNNYAPGETPEELYPHLFTKQHAKDTQKMWGKLMKRCGVKAFLGK